MTSAAYSKVRESPRDWRTVRFIKRKPQPAIVVGIDRDGEEIRVKCGGVRGAQSWADAARALHDCDSMKALDENGDVLRVLTHDESDPVLVAEAEKEASPKTPFAHGGAPIISIDVPKLVKEIADAMKDVARSSAEAQSAAHADGFKAMGQVVQLCMNLLVRLEERLDLPQVAPAVTVADPPNQNDMLAQQLLGRVLGGGSPAPSSSGGLDLQALLRSVSPEQMRQFLELMQSGGATVEDVDDSPTNGAAHGH